MTSKLISPIDISINRIKFHIALIHKGRVLQACRSCGSGAVAGRVSQTSRRLKPAVPGALTARHRVSGSGAFRVPNTIAPVRDPPAADKRASPKRKAW